MTKIVVKEVDGEKIATATVEFNLGKIYQEEVSEDGMTRTIIAGMNIDGMERYFKQLLKDGMKQAHLGEFDDRLEQYVNLRINQMIGIVQSPLELDAEGNIKTSHIADDVEVVVEG